MSGSRPVIAFSAAFAERLGVGGHSWFVLQWVCGLERLGYDVILLDRLLEPAVGDRRAADAVAAVRAFGSDAEVVVLGPKGDVLAGPDRPSLLARLGGAIALLDVMGYLADDELRDAVEPRVFIDIDPGFPQLWRDLGLHDAFVGFDQFVTIAERIGKPDCSVPACGIRWVTTKQPVLLDRWASTATPPVGAPWTTVGMWRGPNDPIERDGVTYGLRVHEFRKLVDLPARTGAPFAVALDMDPGDVADRELLESRSWQLVDPAEAAGDTDRYRAFIESSYGELLVAKQLYVLTRGGWFSDRSACYLAAGRPVVAQDTGLDELLPTGAGLLTYTTLEEAADAIARVAAEPERHRAAARAVATDHFDAVRVLGTLLERLGLR